MASSRAIEMENGGHPGRTREDKERRHRLGGTLRAGRNALVIQLAKTVTDFGHGCTRMHTDLMIEKNALPFHPGALEVDQ